MQMFAAPWLDGKYCESSENSHIAVDSDGTCPRINYFQPECCCYVLFIFGMRGTMRPVMDGRRTKRRRCRRIVVDERNKCFFAFEMMRLLTNFMAGIGAHITFKTVDVPRCAQRV